MFPGRHLLGGVVPARHVADDDDVRIRPGAERACEVCADEVATMAAVGDGLRHQSLVRISNHAEPSPMT